MMIVLLFFGCFDDLDSSMVSSAAGERQEELAQRQLDLAERWKAYDARKVSRIQTVSNRTYFYSTRSRQPLDSVPTHSNEVLLPL